ncbi:MAG: AEC family transporter [Firmicutes bacterium]|jgi:predicted permease|nr:AEC family transporter [Bacillota bacterium]
MVSFKSLIDLQITLFILIMIGYLLTKSKIINKESGKTLADLLVYFILPSNIIISFLMEFNLQILKEGLVILIVSACIQMITPLLGKYIYPGSEGKELAVLRYGTVVSNAGYLGNPMALALYGSQGLLYASIFLIPQRIVVWSLGVSYFTGNRGKKMFKQILFHPCILAVIVGLVLMLAQIKLPSALVKVLQHGSNSVTPISMVLIGNLLADISFKSLINKTILWYTTVRLILIPAAVLAICSALNLPTMVTVISTLLVAMPAGATTAILAAQHDGDDVLAAKIVFFTTFLSLITVPIFILIMNKL